MMMTLTNIFCRLLLACIYFTSFLRTAQTADSDDACKVFGGKTVTFYSCGTDCSQRDFNCSIGKKQEVEMFAFSDEPSLAPPDLIDIKYLDDPIKGQEDYCARSIYIQFRLPPAFRRVFPNAVRLFFQGLSKDDYYHTCPRHRIFTFHNYNPESMRESEHPRNISYNCFYGVENKRIIIERDYRIKCKKGYLLGLKSNPGRWINYTVTINVYSHARHQIDTNWIIKETSTNTICPVKQIEQWIPAIAVSLDINNRTIKVLVEKEPNEVQLQYSEALLLMVDNKAGISESLVDQKCTFQGLVHGRYIVRAVIYGTLNEKFQNWTGESVEIDATGIPKDDASVKPLKIFSMVGGCLIGLALLVLLGGIVYRHRVCKKVLAINRTAKGFILHPYDYEPHSIALEFITKFGHLMENKCICSLSLWKPTKFKSRAELKNWLENEFTSLTFVLVFYNISCYDVEDINANFYSCILNEAVKRKRMSQLHIIPIRLTRSHSLPSVISQEIGVNWDDLENLYCRIHGHEDVPPERKKSLSGKWKSTSIGKDLLELFRRLPIQNASDSWNQQTDIREDVLSVRQPVNNEDLACAPPGKEEIDLKSMKDLVMSLNRSDENLIESQNKADNTKAPSDVPGLYDVKAEVHSDSAKNDEAKSPHQHTPPDNLHNLHYPQQYPCRSDRNHHLMHSYRVPDIEEMNHTAGHQQHMFPYEDDILPVKSSWLSHHNGFCGHTDLPNLEMNGQFQDECDPFYHDETYPMIQRECKGQADFFGNQGYRPATCKHQNMHDLPQIPSFGKHLHQSQFDFPDIDMDLVHGIDICGMEDFPLPIYFRSGIDVPHRNALLPDDTQFTNPNGCNANNFLSKLHHESMPLLGENTHYGRHFMAMDPPLSEKKLWSQSSAPQGPLQHKPHYNRKCNSNQRIDNTPMVGNRMDLNALDLQCIGRPVVKQGHFQFDDGIMTVSQRDLTEDDFEHFAPLPLSNHESEESIASGNQLDELRKINEEASK